MKKEVENGEIFVKAVNAAEFLKRNTDSLKHAVENDLFCTAPELQRLYEITEL